MTSVIKALNGVVDSDDGRSSAVGKYILEELGGNAVDAAVAVALVLGVINQGSSGLGGGSFMLVRMHDGRIQGFDMRETAPANATEAFYLKNLDDKSKGPKSIAIPGELKGLHAAWKMFGSKSIDPSGGLEWSKLVEPAIRFALEGFTISPYLHYQMRVVEKGINIEKDIRNDPGMSAIYIRDGQLVKQGDVVKNPKLAETLTVIAAEGVDAFYKGKIADDIVGDIKKAGGIVTKSDFMNYEVELRKPLAKDIHHAASCFNLFTMPPPASGGAGIYLMFNILKNYGFPEGVKGDVGLHRFIESCKHMFAVRSHLGDPKFDDITEVLKDMQSPCFAKELYDATSDDYTITDPRHYGGKWHIYCNDHGEIIKDHGTSHMSIVDCQRNAVALTTSVNYHFGSRFLSPSTGVLLNNTMDDFFLPKVFNTNTKIANRIEGNKRPLSSMNPTIILKDGCLNFVVGSSGGFRIPPGTAQVLLNYFARGDDILSSIMQPRVFHQLIPEFLEYEDWTTAKGYHFEIPEETREFLHSKGHKLKLLKENNMCQFIQVGIPPNQPQILIYPPPPPRKEYMHAASDPRKGSYPDGY